MTNEVLTEILQKNLLTLVKTQLVITLSVTEGEMLVAHGNKYSLSS